MTTHTGEKSYNCQVCTYSFSRVSNLKTHMTTHTGEKSYNCQVCTYSCITVGNLKTHMMKHTEVKSYSCQLCTYSCSQANILRLHTGEKPHKCHLCTLTFKHRKSLKAHEYKGHVKITELNKTTSEKPVEKEQIADLNPVISSSGSEGQNRVETVFCCSFKMCSFTLTKVGRLLFKVHNPAPASNSCSSSTLLLLTWAISYLLLPGPTEGQRPGCRTPL